MTIAQLHSAFTSFSPTLTKLDGYLRPLQNFPHNVKFAIDFFNKQRPAGAMVARQISGYEIRLSEGCRFESGVGRLLFVLFLFFRCPSFLDWIFNIFSSSQLHL